MIHRIAILLGLAFVTGAVCLPLQAGSIKSKGKLKVSRSVDTNTGVSIPYVPGISLLPTTSAMAMPNCSHSLKILMVQKKRTVDRIVVREKASGSDASSGTGIVASQARRTSTYHVSRGRYTGLNTLTERFSYTPSGGGTTDVGVISLTLAEVGKARVRVRGRHMGSAQQRGRVTVKLTFPTLLQYTITDPLMPGTVSIAQKRMITRNVVAKVGNRSSISYLERETNTSRGIVSGGGGSLHQWMSITHRASGKAKGKLTK